MKDIVVIPLYYNFKFYSLEFDAHTFHNRRYLWPEASLTNFWEKIYRTFFNKKAEEYLRHLVDCTISRRVFGLGSCGITFLNEDSVQFRNTRLVYSREDILNNRTTFDKLGRYVYKEYDLKNTIHKLSLHGVNEEWAEDLVKHVNHDERDVIKTIAENSKGSKWDYLKSYFLTDEYIIKRLKRQGLNRDQINYDLISAESLLIETSRKLKTII